MIGIEYHDTHYRLPYVTYSVKNLSVHLDVRLTVHCQTSDRLHPLEVDWEMRHHIAQETILHGLFAGFFDVIGRCSELESCLHH